MDSRKLRCIWYFEKYILNVDLNSNRKPSSLSINSPRSPSPYFRSILLSTVEITESNNKRPGNTQACCSNLPRFTSASKSESSYPTDNFVIIQSEPWFPIRGTRFFLFFPSILAYPCINEIKERIFGRRFVRTRSQCRKECPIGSISKENSSVEHECPVKIYYIVLRPRTRLNISTPSIFSLRQFFPFAL